MSEKDKISGAEHRIKDMLVKFEANVSSKIAEIANKHNDVVAKVAAIEGMVSQVAAFTASETGKFQGTVQGQMQTLGQSMSGIDLNVLALAELNKEVIGQLVQIDAIFKKLHGSVLNLFANTHTLLGDGSGAVRQLTNEDIAAFKNALEVTESDVSQIKVDADAWYSELLKSSFGRARERIENQAKAAAAEAELEAAAAVVAEEAAKNAAEETAVQAELKNAELVERAVTAAASGGAGAAFPEGAEIFGG